MKKLGRHTIVSACRKFEALHERMSVTYENALLCCEPFDVSKSHARRLESIIDNHDFAAVRYARMRRAVRANVGAKVNNLNYWA